MPKLGWVAVGLGVVVLITTGVVVYVRLTLGQEEVAAPAVRLKFAPITAPPEALKARKIAFVSFKSGEQDIWLVEADGSSRTRLTQSLKNEYAPTWSPDGRRLAFLRTEGDFEGGFKKVTLCVLDIESGQETVLAEVPSSWPIRPAWSPEGTKLALLTFDDGGTRRYWDDDTATLFLVKSDGGQETLVEGFHVYQTPPHPPNWSPDGNLILFHGEYEGIAGLFAIGQEGEVSILYKGYEVVSPTWSPDGAQIAFINPMGNTIEVLDVQEGSTREVTHFAPAWVWELVWSPDGRRLLYSAHFEGGGSELSVVDVGSGEVMVLDSGAESYFGLCWSPDGSRIAFTRWSEGVPPTIYLINADGSGLVKLVEEGWSPAW
jgi:Tol biopolymer transport system component